MFLSEKCVEAKETLMFCQQLSTVVIETIRVCVTDWERGKEDAWGEEQRIINCVRLEKGGRGNMYDADKIACENPHELFSKTPRVGYRISRDLGKVS